MDAWRLSAQLHDRSHGRFPVHLQSEKRRHRLLSSESEDGRPHVHRTIHSGGYAGDHYLQGGAGLIPRGASSPASARFSFISRELWGTRSRTKSPRFGKPLRNSVTLEYGSFRL